jgi:hypothetical protein
MTHELTRFMIHTVSLALVGPGAEASIGSLLWTTSMTLCRALLGSGTALLLVSIAMLCGCTAQQPVVATKTLCVFNGWYGGVPWAAITPSFYAADFPGARFNLRILNSTDDLRLHVQTYLSNGADCDVLTLVGYSPYCIALSPVMLSTVAWVDASATSTQLSDKLANPYFNRVIPTDAVGAGAAAVFAYSQGWRLANVLCNDESYGLSVAQGFSSRFNKLGGSIEYSRCVSPSFTADTFQSALDGILSQSQSNVRSTRRLDKHFSKRTSTATSPRRLQSGDRYWTMLLETRRTRSSSSQRWLWMRPELGCSRRITTLPQTNRSTH